MDKTDKKLKTFCPLPWNHISSTPSGHGRVCCEGFEILKDNYGQIASWKKARSLHSYCNSEDYKKIRRQMLKGNRPSHCFHCFQQEDHGAKSMRLQFIDYYYSDIKKMIDSTNEDGSVDKPEITYLDMPLGNKCNLKCRMCTPSVSYLIAKDWKKMGKAFDEDKTKKILKDKWYASPNTLQMLNEALPHVKVIFTAGGEPMLIKEHLKTLEMIIEKGHADHILLRYNSNQTVIPTKIIDLWKHFKAVVFNCSVEANGPVNDYIRYPSKWEHLEKNVHFLDDLSYKYKHIEIYIHTTFQAYNAGNVPKFLHYLRHENFKSLYRFPFFIWVKNPQWLSPCVLPQKMRYKIVDEILKSLDEHEDFFLSYNKTHHNWSRERMKVLKSLCDMMKNDTSQEKYFNQFIEETKKHDNIRKQSVLSVLPELKTYFSQL